MKRIAILAFLLCAAPASATTPSSTPFPEPLNVLAYGVKGDAHWGDTSCSWSAGSAGTVQVDCPSYTFTAADVGKTVVLDLAGPSNAPLVTTFSGAGSDSHHETVADAVSFASTYSLPTVVDVDSTNYGSGYLPGDTGHCCGGAPAYTVKVAQVVSATVHSGGSGGTTGTVNLMGSSAALAGQPFILVGSIGGGGALASVSGGITRTGYYNAYTAPVGGEPVTVVIKDARGNWIPDNSNPLSGATINLSFGVAPGGLAMTRSTTAVNNFSCPSASTTTADTGSGTGLKIDCSSIAATASWYTDNYNAFQTAETAQLNFISAGKAKCLLIPAGNYGTAIWNFSLVGRGYVCGESTYQFPWITNVFVTPNSGGDMVAVTDCGHNNTLQSQGGTPEFSDPTNNLTAGCGVKGVTFIGMRESTAIQNAVMIAGSCVWCSFDVLAYHMRGRCIGTEGDSSSRAGLAESSVNYRCERDGDVDINTGGGHVEHVPSIDITALGTGALNNVKIGCSGESRVFQSFGMAIHLADDSTPGGNGAHNITVCPGTHAEASGMGGTGAGGDLLRFGDDSPTTTDYPKLGGGLVTGQLGAGVANNKIYGSFTNPQFGFAAYRTYDGSNLQFLGEIGSTNEALGKGIDHEQGCSNCDDEPTIDSPFDYPYTVQGGGRMNTFTFFGTEANVPSNIEAAQQPTGANSILYPAWTTVPGFPTFSFVNGLIAHSGVSSTNATRLSGAISAVSTVVSSGDSVVLEPEANGVCQFVINSTGTNMTVFADPVAGDSINGAASITQVAGASRWYCGYKTNNWRT